MRRLWCLLAASPGGCTFDYGALEGSASAPDDYQAYAEVVDDCASAWRHVFGATFDDPDENLNDLWDLPESVNWRIDEGHLAVAMPKFGGDYWTTHIVARDLAVENLWMRVDVEVHVDRYTQLQARVDPEQPSARFYAMRTRGDLGGIGLHRQIEAADAPNADQEVYYTPTLQEGTFYRHVFTARTRQAGNVEVTGGIYAIPEDDPPTLHQSVVGTTYGDDEAIGAGSIGLSGWQNELRFDNVQVFSCDR